MKIFYILIILCYSFSSGISIYSQVISGYQWEEVTNIPDPYSNIYWLDVFFLKENPHYGWLSGYGGSILRTTNGGLSWSGMKIQKMKIDSLWNGTNYDYDTTYFPLVNQLESLSFIDENIGFVSGDNSIYKTTDGGVSWESIIDTNFHGDIWGNSFISAETGIMVGGGCQVNEKQQFYRTTNGGQTWSEFFGNEINTGLSDAILFAGDGLGYASSSGMIWITNNGGKIWNILCVTGTSNWQEDIAISSNTIFVPYSEGCDGGGNSGGLRISKDMGKTWSDFQTSETMFGTFLLDTLRGWGVGQGNSIYYTYDAGENWHLLNSGLKDNYPADDVWFINDTCGWVVGLGVYKFTGKIIIDVVEEIEYNKLIQNVSPNPVENILSISINTDKHDVINISLFSLTGNIIFKETLLTAKSGQNEIRIDLSNMSSGMYVLQIQQGTNFEFQKIVKY